MNTGVCQVRDESVPQTMEVGYTARGVAVGDPRCFQFGLEHGRCLLTIQGKVEGLDIWPLGR